jgi:hypothetical protein
MDEVSSRLAKNEHEINNIFSQVKELTNKIESYKMQQEHSTRLVYIWIAFSVSLVLTSIFMTQLGAPFLKAVEFISSWVTCLFLIFGGIYAAKITYRIDKITGYIVSGSWAVISTCYIGYVLLDFGASHPAAAAIGFNIGASFQTGALIAIAVLLHKVYNKIKNNG